MIWGNAVGKFQMLNSRNQLNRGDGGAVYINVERLILQVRLHQSVHGRAGGI